MTAAQRRHIRRFIYSFGRSRAWRGGYGENRLDIHLGGGAPGDDSGLHHGVLRATLANAREHRALACINRSKNK